MGMSASQARMLFISSRMHDVELKSQQIANQKIRLASESEEIANDYAKALNKTQLVVRGTSDDGSVTTSQLSYNSIMRHDGAMSGYTLRNANNNLILSPNMIKVYESSKGDMQKFIQLMGVDVSDIATKIIGYEDDLMNPKTVHHDAEYGVDTDLLESDAEQAYEKYVVENTGNTGGTGQSGSSSRSSSSASSSRSSSSGSSSSTGGTGRSGSSNGTGGTSRSGSANGSNGANRSNGAEIMTKDDFIANFKDDHINDDKYSILLQDAYDETTYEKIPLYDFDWDNLSGDAKFYGDLFKDIETSGYDSRYSSWTNDNFNSNEFLQNMIENGEWFICKETSDGKSVQKSISELSQISEVSDKTDIAKAEAEYNAKTSKINRKEKQLDMQLKQLDTEHSALSAEQDSIKNLVKDNISKSFNMFS